MPVIELHSNPVIRCAQESHYRLVKASPKISIWTDRDPEKLESVLNMLTDMRNKRLDSGVASQNDYRLFELGEYINKVRQYKSGTDARYISEYDASVEVFFSTAIELYECYAHLVSPMINVGESSSEQKDIAENSPVAEAADILRHYPNALNLQAFLGAVAEVVGRFVSSVKHCLETAKEHHIEPLQIVPIDYLRRLGESAALVQKNYISLYATGNSSGNLLGANVSSITALISEMEEQIARCDEESKRILDTTQNLTDADNAFDEFFTTLHAHAESVSE